MISAFKEIIEKIGIEHLSTNVLFECVCQKLPNLLEYLLSEGANPNINFFSQSYSWVSSSSLYEIFEEGNYFSSELKKWHLQYLNQLSVNGLMARFF